MKEKFPVSESNKMTSFKISHQFHLYMIFVKCLKIMRTCEKNYSVGDGPLFIDQKVLC